LQGDSRRRQRVRGGLQVWSEPMGRGQGTRIRGFGVVGMGSLRIGGVGGPWDGAGLVEALAGRLGLGRRAAIGRQRLARRQIRRDGHTGFDPTFSGRRALASGGASKGWWAEFDIQTGAGGGRACHWGDIAQGCRGVR